MDHLLTVIDGVTVLVVWAGLVWLVQKATVYLDTQKRLEQQVKQLQQTVQAAEQKIASQDEQLEFRAKEDDFLRGRMYAERDERLKDVTRVQTETKSRYGDLLAKVADLEAAVARLSSRFVFDRSPAIERIRQASKDRENGPADPNASDAPRGR